LRVTDAEASLRAGGGAVMLLIGAATAHSWYPKECCHDNDCHGVACEEIEKIGDGCCGATRRPNNATGFRTIDCTHRTMTLVSSAFRH
jgi:hypothetical protein